MTRLRQAKFDWQIGPWLLSALVGWLIAYNTSIATMQLGLVISGVALYLLFYNLADRRGLRLMLAWLPPIVTVVFAFTGDWSHVTSQLPLLDPGLRWFAAWQPKFGIMLNPNVAGGVIATFIPLQAWALRNARRSSQVFLLGLALIGLVLSASRGAWLAFGLALAMWILWRITNQWIATRRIARAVWFSIVLIGAIALIAVLTLTPLGDRPWIWRNSVDLIGDYPFTGFGFASFEMAYSSYALLVHVGHTIHAHNLWLDLWLDQGLLGAVAFAGLIINALRPRPNASHWRLAALASLSVILVHGLFDDAFYGYGGAAMSLLLIPVAIATRPAESEAATSARSINNPTLQPAFVVWMAAMGLVIVTLILPGGRAMWETNLGTIDQTRAELSEYHWPDVPIQDALRQGHGVNLNSAIQHYEAAQLLDSSNASANRRYGQIELARGEWVSACAHLQNAYAARPEQRATRQLYGECLALNGQIAQAAELWHTVDLSQGQIDLRVWWYESYRGEVDRAMALKRAVAESKRN